MRTEARRAALRGVLAALLLLATSACLWHGYAPPGTHLDDAACATCHAAHGFGAAVAATAWPVPEARADAWTPAPDAATVAHAARRPYAARAPPVPA